MGYKIHAGPVELPNPLMVESTAKTAFLPGNIVTKTGGEFAVGAAASVGQLLIVKENGPGVGGHVDDAFVVDAPVDAYIARQGLFFRARVVTASALVAGETMLERAASGQLKVLASGVAVAVAKETVTTTAANQLVLVEVL